MGRKEQARRVTRQAKQSTKQGQVIDFPEQSFDESLPQIKRDNTPIEPRNSSQLDYQRALETKQLIFATGEAGCGKTFLAAAYAAERLLAKDFDRIIVTRPVLSADEDLGFLPGDMSEKFAPYFRPVYDVLQKRLGGNYLRYCLKPGIDKVEIAPFAYMRGRNFENAVVILDEAQNTTAQQMKLFLTRIGENCLVIVNGDVTQCDLPHHVKSGLGDALSRFEDDDLVGLIRFTKEDCVRSLLCQRTLYAYGEE